VPGIAVVPTLFTLGNLVAGFAAIHYAARPIDYEGPWGWTGLTLAGILIFVGMFFDGIDGSIARLTRSSSTIGGQLDSLCDMLTFGVAPAFMALRLVIGHFEGTGADAWVIGPDADSVLGKIVWAIAAVYVCCAAMRLARFSVESGLSQVNDHRLFRGLPTPGAAGAVASLVILHQHYLVVRFEGELPHELVRWTTLVIPAVMALCALAMVSSIPYIHFANTYLRGSKSFGFIVRLVVILVLMIWFLQEILAIAFLTYALSGPTRLGWRWFRRGKSPAAAT
jgi:CDP-diacylglycerol--serine O-phosphatidyltransferase